MNKKRAIRIISETVSALELDLKNQVVLTEVGSNQFVFTPIIPLLAGADYVYAWVRDSRYGKAEDIVKECKAICNSLNVKNIEFGINERPLDHIKNATVITNSGFVRPIDKHLLQANAAAKAVVPLMYEAWEYRDGEIDLAYCKEKQIHVAGTWENHPLLRVFDHVEMLAIKLALDAGYEIKHNKIIIWSTDEFGKKAKEAFENCGASSVECTTEREKLLQSIETIDFIFLCDYEENISFFNYGDNGGMIKVDEFCALGINTGIIHLYGDIRYESLKEKGLHVYPQYSGKRMVMSKTLSYVGEIPVLKLLCGGFKVAELMLKEKQHSLIQPIV